MCRVWMDVVYVRVCVNILKHDLLTKRQLCVRVRVHMCAPGVYMCEEYFEKMTLATSHPKYG